MTSNSTQEHLDIASDYVQKIGDEIAYQQTVEPTNGEEFEVLMCFKGDSKYGIYGFPDYDYLSIVFEYSLLERLAVSLDSETIENHTGEYVDTDEIAEVSPENTGDGEIIIGAEQDENPPEIRAAKSIVESIDEEINERFIFDLFQQSSYPQVSTEIKRTENGYFSGFSIRRKIFPDDSGFNLTEFNNSVQSVVSIGVFAENTVIESLGEKMQLSSE